MQARVFVPETKPATEWVRGRLLQKMSPRTTHSRQQKRWLLALEPWAQGRGFVGPEWRFWIPAEGGVSGALTPDVAYVCSERLRALAPQDEEEPPIAPDIAIEVRSKGDRQADIEWKISRYLESGAQLVVVDDPQQRTISAYDPRHDVAHGPRVFAPGQRFEHPAAPGFLLDVAAHFEPEPWQ